MTAPAGGTIKVPVFGTQKKTTVYLVGGAVVVFLGVSFIRARGKPSAESTAAPEAEINPATGFPFGSPEDAQATAASSAYQNPVDYGGGGGPPATTPPTSTGYANNAQWTQAAAEYLTTTADYSGSTVLAALGKYVSGQPVVKGSAQDSIILQAIAAEGRPPQAGDNGYPPSIRHTTAPEHPTPTPTPPSKKTALTAPHLRVSAVSRRRHQARITWGAVAGAKAYTVYHHDGPLRTVTTHDLLVKDDGNYYVRAIAADTAHHTNSKLSNPVRVSGI